MNLRKLNTLWLMVLFGLACGAGPWGLPAAFGRLAEEYAATLQEMEDEHESLINLWTEAMQARERMAELMMVLGSEARRQAESEMRALELQQERLAARFAQTVERELRPYQRQLDRLQNQRWRLQNELDGLDAARARGHAEAIQELQSEAVAVQRRVHTMQAMRRALHFDLPRGESIARLPRGTDPQRTYRYLQRHAPRLLEDRMNLLDSLADIKNTMEEKEAAGDAWSAQQEYQLERQLANANRARRILETLIERELRGDLRIQERLQRSIERLESRMEGAGERRQERMREDLLELQNELSNAETQMARYRALLEFDRDFQPVFEFLSE